MSVKCPKCGSEDVTAMKKGFSGGKAVAGAVLTGGVGLLAGLHGSGKIKVACLACGNEWDPKDLKAEAEHQERMKNFQEDMKWRRDLYALYDNKDLEKAEEMFLQKFKFNQSIPNIHAGYKHLKGDDSDKTTTGALLAFAFVAVVIFIIYKLVS